MCGPVWLFLKKEEGHRSGRFGFSNLFHVATGSREHMMCPLDGKSFLGVGSQEVCSQSLGLGIPVDVDQRMHVCTTISSITSLLLFG
jgi:hypothetical protein